MLKKWVKETVIGLNLCPFAKPVFESNLIRFSETDLVTEDEASEFFLDELAIIQNALPQEISTTLLAFNKWPIGFYDFNDLFKKTELEKKLNNSLGIWYDWKNNNILKTFRLKFTDWAIGIVENKKVHRSQKIIERTKDYIIIEITVWDNPEIEFFIKQFRGYCEKC
jgi:hypothetical protein